ncbi:MAG TPA: T9SS type A sorting domain-containing protein [Bacteroidales bacterium]|nr:T9SS type A sorting domain-containing protein [Bacteroidales bacterium]
MKKTLLFLAALFFVAAIGKSQTATSVANGNWYMPTTWDCMCIPTAAYTVNVNHDVVLDNDFALNGGTINIASSGVLRENTSGRYLVMNTGSITNNGKMKISRVGFYGGNFVNNDSCLFYSVFFSGAETQNFGTITGADSLFIQADFYNADSAVVDAFRVTVNDTLENNGQLAVSELLNLSVFINEGLADFINFYSANYSRNSSQLNFTDFTNEGGFDNYGAIYGTSNFHNIGHFYNDTVAVFTVGNDFSNVDTINQLAYYNNNGHVGVLGNLYNGDTIAGTNTGSFCISEASTNDGVMLGTFNFYDQSNGGPPALDNGYISPTVTFYAYPCVPAVGTIDNSPWLSVYPNPAADMVNFEFSEVPSNAIITITDGLGNIIFSQSVSGQQRIIFTKGKIPAGLYIYTVNSDGQMLAGKILLQ